ncbi:dipeptidase [Streptomyces sp. NPDC012461]|jgi:microsomal dipeptidase-like Zn-dependent dipeptidase|uniref:Membrane dipeptidase n=4 Tax=unclassified Streptomyces TaxID=2593676 RepID=A0A6G3QXW8_9ACTN|nr:MULTISPECIES: dipeptidase [unclassified Streptomyces]NEA88185.1 membrane dipeptidase [Streptomyces sp. SID14436]NEC31072.1 membrane dipeptidase [Streptomyces sp. SID8111]
MADLQDELHPATEVGRPDEPAESVLDEAVVVPPDPGLPLSAPDDSPLSRARALLAVHPVADGCSGLPGVLRDLPWYDLDLGDRAVEADLPRLRDGGVGAVFWSLRLPDDGDGGHAVVAALDQLDLARSVVAAHDEGLLPARTAGEIADARNRGRIAVLFGPVGARATGDSLGVLRALHGLGLRVLSLHGTSWAGPAGLTRFGEEVVREMNRLGVLPDLTDASARTVRRVLDVSRAPVLFSRSAARALRPHPANLPDDLLAEVGAAGGLCLVPLTAEQTGPTVRDVADHLDHVRRTAGPECVGLSGTYDTGAAHPQELPDTSGYPKLVAELLRRGWSEPEVGLLTWGNIQRVLRGADFTARAARHRRPPSTATLTDLDGTGR